ncbi:MAG: recombinase family protein [Muribaculaceae bacterium]|nr:recombinase family protein [Muribaculaceae bacterium]
MTIGYVRVSTSKQHPANQLEEIQRFADTRSFVIDRFVIEIVSGRTAEKDRKLGALLRRMKKGDTLIVTEISRLSRTMTEIMSIMGRCLERGINLYTTKEGYTFDNSINSKVLCFAFGLVAEIERNLISMRTKEALMLRRAEGVTLGRRHGSYTKTSILIDNKPHVMEMLDSGCTIGEICRYYRLSRETFNRLRRTDNDITTALLTRKKHKCRN